MDIDGSDHSVAEFSDEEMEAGSEKEEEGDLLEHLASLFIEEQRFSFKRCKNVDL